jgi:hypothetical protein
MWGKRPKPGGKGLRCNIVVVGLARGSSYKCDRPAKRYACEKRGFDLGIIDCCKNHAAKHEKQGITMKLIDRRRKVQA